MEGLDERQANEVLAVLLHNNISAQKKHEGKAGFVVRVGQADLPEAIELMQRESLPSAPRSQISSSFPADSMVSTPLSERVRLLSAIERRLEESLAVIAGVNSARVHVSYDSFNHSGTQNLPQDVHVAAVLVHGPGLDEQALLQSVKRLLRNTFAHVDYDNVSVLLTEAPQARTLRATPESSGSTKGPVVWSALAAVGLLVAVFSTFIRRIAIKLPERLRSARASTSQNEKGRSDAD
ncbi:type III secretion system inner membrane ring lipoprotein SctJ [Dyella sp. Tek66A03]|uniref:type III secretion system inner membrane ring lipoprotein SctJ n=1 Tax=Dyella sp. Tek66A03 TaxID=3458298 RepID=UPI00403E85DC